jgi:hypothetical protein
MLCAAAGVLARPPGRRTINARRIPRTREAARDGRADQAACKPGSVGLRTPRGARNVAAIPLGRSLPTASSNQPGRLAWREGLLLPRGRPRAAPIRFCSRWGLPCRPRCRVRGALLPHPFTLTPRRTARPAGAVCSLWHCPWGRPRRRLSGTVSPWSPDFPPRARGPERPPGRLIRRRDAPWAGARQGASATASDLPGDWAGPDFEHTVATARPRAHPPGRGRHPPRETILPAGAPLRRRGP